MRPFRPLDCAAALVVSGIGAMVAPGAHSADLLWISELGGFFHEPKNWSLTLPPGPNDNARFSYRDASYTVLFGTSGSVRRLEVGLGAVTFDLQSQTMTALLGASLDGPGFRVADEAGQSAALTVRGPGRIVATEGAIATAPGASASVALQSAARLNLTGELRIGGEGVNAGRAGVHLHSGTRVMATSVTLAAGSTLSGLGVVQAALLGAGAIEPGGAGAPGALTVQGAFAQPSAGALRIDLGPSAGATITDRLIVTESASLAGSLALSLLPGYTPTLGDTFTILTAQSITGQFASIVGPDLDGASVTIAYTPTSVTLTIVPAPGAPALLMATLAGLRRVRSRA